MKYTAFVILVFATSLLLAQKAKPTPTAAAKAKPNQAVEVKQSQIADQATPYISEVTIYPQQALVKRTLQLSLAAGIHHVQLGVLPESAQRESVQAGGTGAFSLRDINVVDANKNTAPKEKIAAIKTAIDEIEISLQDLEDREERINEEREYLKKIANKMLEKREKEAALLDMNPENWQKIITFIYLRNAELDKDLRATKRKKEALEQQKQLRENERVNLGGGNRQTQSHVEVTVDVKKAGTITLDLTYMIHGAGWAPKYELHVAAKERTMELLYQAQVWQNSGEDWHGVRLFLSTASPNRASKHPDLQPWRVAFLPPPPPAPAGIAGAIATPKPAQEMTQRFAAPISVVAENTINVDGLAVDEIQPPPPPKMELDAADVSSGATAEFYAISGQNTIASDNQPHKVGIMTHNFPVHFRYSTVPKLAAQAFLKAKAINDSKYTLLTGEANVFLDQNFVTTTRLSRVARDQEFWTFLGNDDDIAVEYKMLKKTAGDKGFLSKKNTLLFENRIVITNHKQSEEEIVVWDQLPIPSHEDIKINLRSPEYKTDTEKLKKTATNYLEMFHKLKPGEKLEIPIIFEIDFPIDKKININ